MFTQVFEDGRQNLSGKFPIWIIFDLIGEKLNSVGIEKLPNWDFSPAFIVKR
jgi:hypothetical protein